MLDAATPLYDSNKPNAQVLKTDMGPWYGKKAQGIDIYPQA